MTEDNTGQTTNEEMVNYVYIPFQSALEVATAMDEKCGGVVTSFEVLENAVGVKGGALRGRVFNAKLYNLIEGRGELKLTKLAQRILHPTEPNESAIATKEAVMSVPLLKKLFERYHGNLPSDEILFKNTLMREYKIPKHDVGRVANAVKKSFEHLSTLNVLDVEIPNQSQVTKPDFTTILQRSINKGEGTFIINFGDDTYSSKISSQVDWETAKAVLNGLQKKWEESQKKKESKTE